MQPPFAETWREETDALSTQLLLARQWLPDVQISREQIEYLVTEAIRGGVEGHRSELYAVRVARAHAALSGRDRVEADDLQVAVALVMRRGLPKCRHRISRWSHRRRRTRSPHRLRTRGSAAGQPAATTRAVGRGRERSAEDNSEDDNTDDDEGDGEEDQAPPAVPEEFMLDPEAIEVDPDLLLFNAAKAKSGNSGSRSVVLSDSRGRYVKPMLPRGPVRRIAVDATLRAAAVPKNPSRAGTGPLGDRGRSAAKFWRKAGAWWCSSWMPAAQWP